MQRVYRLSHNASFNYIYRKGSCVKSPLFLVFFVKAASIKVGISVSKKVGNSVVRSLVKRRIKEAFRLLIPTLNKSCNYIVVAKAAAATATYRQIEDELYRLLGKLGHLVEKNDF